MCESSRGKIVTIKDGAAFTCSWAANASVAKPYICPTSLLTSLTPESLWLTCLRCAEIWFENPLDWSAQSLGKPYMLTVGRKAYGPEERDSSLVLCLGVGYDHSHPILPKPLLQSLV